MFTGGLRRRMVPVVTVVSQALAGFGTWAHTASTRGRGCVYTGDFNGDGNTDIALPCAGDTAGDGTQTLPVAFSNGAGGFTVTNDVIGHTSPDWAAFGYKALTNAEGTIVAGDFNGDGRTDFALATASQNDAGGPDGVPMAFSNGDGSFTLIDQQAPGLVANLDGIPGGPGDFDLATCANLQFCQIADVDGDGQPDRVGFVPAGTQYPALAGDVLVDTGHGLRIWGTGFCLQPQETCKVASVDTGNIAADIVQFDNSTPGKQGNVEVALSNPAGRTFGALTLWGQNFCPVAGETCILGNVNGDFYPDVVDLTHSAPRPGAGLGGVIIGLGTGAGFGQATLWGDGICIQAADFCTPGWAFTGPQGAHTPEDILQVTPDGTASVSFSNGTNDFGALQEWGTGLCVGATICQLLDLNGDGVGDVAYKDINDQSLTSTQLWVAYGAAAGSFAAPVIVDASTVTTAAVTGPATGGITLTASITPARASEPAQCHDIEDALNNASDYAGVYASLAPKVYNLARTVALAAGASPDTAQSIAQAAEQPFSNMANLELDRMVTETILALSNECANTEPYDPNAITG